MQHWAVSDSEVRRSTHTPRIIRTGTRHVPSEADNCRTLHVPLLQAAGWDSKPYSIAEERTITDGRIVPVGKALSANPLMHPHVIWGKPDD